MDRFFCTEILLGKEKLKRLKHSFVVLIGLGAVGSYAAEALARSGAGRIRLVDFDQIKITNFNRHLCALESNLGKSKVEAMKARILEIHPGCKIEALELFAAEESMGTILEGQPDLVIDAMDSLNPKTQILAECHRSGVPVISSMGAALRMETHSIKAGDLFKTSGCPLARALRSRLRKRGIKKGIFCVYSDAPVPKELRPAEDFLNAEEDYNRGRRRRKLGSLPTVPGIFGLTVAHYAILFLAGDFKLKGETTKGSGA